VNAAAERLRSYIDGADGKRQFVSGAFDWQISPDALLQLPERDGALVQRVLPESPAETAGLKRGDLVVRIADQPVLNPSALLQAVERAEVGQPLALKVVRGQKELQLSIRPAALPEKGSA
jgi:S1-C subfamily serine protease